MNKQAVDLQKVGIGLPRVSKISGISGTILGNQKLTDKEGNSQI